MARNEARKCQRCLRACPTTSAPSHNWETWRSVAQTCLNIEENGPERPRTTPSYSPVFRIFWAFRGIAAHGWLSHPNAIPDWRKSLMSALFHHLSKRRLFVSPDRNMATATCAQRPAWGGGEQATLSRCADPEPGATGTAKPQSRPLHCVLFGHAANATFLRPCSTVYASVKLIVPCYALPFQTCAHRLQ